MRTHLRFPLRTGPPDWPPLCLGIHRERAGLARVTEVIPQVVRVLPNVSHDVYGILMSDESRPKTDDDMLDQRHESNARGEHRYPDTHQTEAERQTRQRRDDLKRGLESGDAGLSSSARRRAARLFTPTRKTR